MAHRDVRMHGATPTGRSRSYTYYASDRKINGAQIHVPTEIVDEQIFKLLEGIGVEPRALPRIRELYHEHIQKLKGPSLGEQIAELRARLQRLYEEEANLARRYAVLDLSDKTFELVHREWQDKVFEIQKQIAGLESSTEDIETDLEHALRLLVRMPRLFPRLRTIDQGRLLRILFRRIIIDTQGRVIDFEMHPPFTYLTLLNNPPPEKPSSGGDEPIIWAGLKCFQLELSSKKRPDPVDPGVFLCVKPSESGSNPFRRSARFVGTLRCKSMATPRDFAVLMHGWSNCVDMDITPDDEASDRPMSLTICPDEDDPFRKETGRASLRFPSV